jgi:hypothetical protein
MAIKRQVPWLTRVVEYACNLERAVLAIKEKLDASDMEAMTKLLNFVAAKAVERDLNGECAASEKDAEAFVRKQMSLH